MNTIAVLINVILPVFIVIGAGALASRRLDLDTRTLSRSVLYIFGPALVFRSLLTTELTAEDTAQIVTFILVTTGALGAIAWSMTRTLRYDSVHSNAFLLATLLINSGNYGLSVNFFAFGTPGLERAVLYYSVTSILTNTVGVYLASRGRADPIEAFRNVFRLPLVYAVVLALALRLAGLTTLPQVLFRPIDLVADASVPVLLIVLGIELAQSTRDHEFGTVGLATATRLVVAAVVAVTIAVLMGMEGLTQKVCIIQASMPTAVTSVVLAVEFDTEPGFVTSVVFASTLFSIVTLTVLLGLIA